MEYPVGRFYRFAHEMSEREIAESSLVLGRAVVRAPRRIARRLEIGPDTRCVRLVRLRLAGDRRLLLETSHVPEGLAPALRVADLTRGSLYDLLEAGGVRVNRVTEDVRAVTLSAGEAATFGLEAATPALALERLAWTRDRAVEHRLVLAPSDRVTLTAAWGAEAAGQL